MRDNKILELTKPIPANSLPHALVSRVAKDLEIKEAIPKPIAP